MAAQQEQENDNARVDTSDKSENRAASLKRSKDRLREMVQQGYYPTVQISGPPMVTATESIDDH